MPRRRRILVLGSSAGGGDWPPLAAATSALIERGHEVVYLGDPELAEATRGSNLTIDAVPAGRDLGSYMKPWLEELETNPQAPMPIPRWTEDALPLAVSLAGRVKPEVLVCTDFTLLLGDALRAKVDRPLCLIHSTFFVGEKAKRRIEDDFAPAHYATARGMAAFMEMADSVLLATDPVFDPPPDSHPANHHWVGPLMWEPVQSLPAYLQSAGEPWALITLSSNRQPGEVQLARAALTALGGFALRPLLTLADTMSRDDIGPLPDKARLEPYAPHSPILQRAALCVSHAGHGIVSKALYFGVPMVLIPWDRDQPGVAARAEALGVARVVRRQELSAERLSAAIQDVLTDTDLKERAALHGRRLRAQDARATACNLIEEMSADAVR
jgi:UDP:flavonoid glycosyltransferase YjiC (YdhE family)